MKSEKNGKFLKGAVVLMLFGLLSKVVGAVYRIPLTSIITAEGMGMYQMVFPLYTLLLTISSSGLPSSISKIISENLAKNRYRQAERTMKVSFILLISFSVLCSLIVFFGAKFFASVQGNKDVYICYLGLCPAIIFVGLISGYRGYFQGLMKMFPSAVSGFFEQIFKLGFGLWLSSVLVKKGINYGVLGALLGVSISEAFAFLYLFLTYIIYKRRHAVSNASDDFELSYKKTAGKILSLSLFVTLGGLIMPISMLIDSSVTINILKSIGYGVKSATTLFGLQTGSVGSIVNMPVVLSLSVATAILPCVSHQVASKDFEGAKESASRALLIAIIFALPSSVGCFSLAEPIIRLLYARSLNAVEIEISAKILEVASISIFYLALLQVTSGLLQGLNCFYVPLISLIVGGIAKVVLNLILIRIPQVNILGAEVSNAICYSLALIINLAVLKRKGVIKMDFRLLGVIILSGMVYFSKYVFVFLRGLAVNFYVSLLITLVMVVGIYFFFIFILYKKQLFHRKKV